MSAHAGAAERIHNIQARGDHEDGVDVCLRRPPFSAVVLGVALLISLGTPAASAAVTNPLEASFAWSEVGYCYSDIWNRVTFHANTSGGLPPYAFAWNFDDGSPLATTEGPSHSYVATGSFNVTLTVTDAAGTRVATNRTVLVVPPSCPVRFAPPWLEFGGALGAVGLVFVAVWLVSRRRVRPGP